MIFENINDIKHMSNTWYITRPTLERRQTLGRLRSIYPDMMPLRQPIKDLLTFENLFFFQALKGNCEKCCIFRLNWWGPTSNLKLPFLDSSHTNNHLYIIYQSIMEMFTYFHRMSLNKNCGCMIFSVAYPYRKSMSIIERVIYIYIYIEFLASYICDPSRVYRNLPGGR